MPTLKLVVAQLIIVVLGSTAIVAYYVWAHPGGYAFLALGLVIVAVASGRAARRATAKLGIRKWLGMTVTACCAGLAVFATLWVSMVVLLNTYGS